MKESITNVDWSSLFYIIDVPYFVIFVAGYLSIGHETGSKRIECLVTRFSRCVQIIWSSACTKNWLFPGEFGGSHIFRANMPTFVECCSTSWFSMQTQWICCMKPSGISWMIREVNQKPSNTWNGHGKHSYMMATWQYEQCSKSMVDDYMERTTIIMGNPVLGQPMSTKTSQIPWNCFRWSCCDLRIAWDAGVLGMNRGDTFDI